MSWKLEEVGGDLFSQRCEKDRDGDFGGVGTILHLVREDVPVLRHRFATEAELLGALATASADKDAEVRAAVLVAAKKVGGPFSQRAAEKAVTGANDAIRRAYKDLKLTGQLGPDGSYQGAP